LTKLLGRLAGDSRWIEEQIPQCGYCQCGQIMKAAELLAETPMPTRDQIIAPMAGNICRCGTYLRISRAMNRAVKENFMKKSSTGGS
jgi:isoquinoline 1-oxidoreductase alpha subunit